MVAADQLEIESEVHYRGRMRILLIGSTFAVIGFAGLLTAGELFPKGVQSACAYVGSGAMLSIGIAAARHSFKSLYRPQHIRHAPPTVLPEVPTAPVVYQGAELHRRLKHELVETSDGWLLRCRPTALKRDKRLMFLLGAGSTIGSAAALSWMFHEYYGIGGWAVSITCATLVSLVLPGSVFVLLGYVSTAGYLRLCELYVPRDRSAIKLLHSSISNRGLVEPLWELQCVEPGVTEKDAVRLPRDLVVAVQLCPWLFTLGGPGGNQIASAVQGVLVLTSPNRDSYYRIPLLLTSDYVQAAVLMEHLARALSVPYLYYGHSEGWRIELTRAQGREPLENGAIHT